MERGTFQLRDIGIHFYMYWSSYLIQPLGGLLYQREHFVAAHTCLALEPSEDYSRSAHSIVSDSQFYNKGQIYAYALYLECVKIFMCWMNLL